MELQRVTKNTLTSLEWHWCHQRNVKLFGVSQINWRWLPCIGSREILLSALNKTVGLSYFSNSRDPWDTCLKSRGTPILAQELEISSMDAIASREESLFPGLYWRGRPTFHKLLKRSFPSEICMWEGTCAFCFKWNRPWDALTQRRPDFTAEV